MGGKAVKAGQDEITQEAEARAGSVGLPWQTVEGSLMIFEQRNDTIRAVLQRINLEVVCGKDLREGSEHFITWKALSNIHKSSFITQHKYFLSTK